MVEAIFFDIDGTLVSMKTHTIPQSAYDALNALKQKGIKTFISTGRGKYEFANLFDFEFDGYVTLNGQHCYDSKGNTIYINKLDIGDLHNLVDFIDEHHIACSFTDGNEKHYNFINDAVLELHAMGNTEVSAVRDLRSTINDNVLQATVFLDYETEKKLIAVMPHSEGTRWYHTFCDVSPLGGSKKNGIEQVCKHYGIDMANTMAFGDGGNDVSMLQCVGTAICMGNGFDELKAVADYITDSVDDNGIYNALVHFGVLDK